MTKAYRTVSLHSSLVLAGVLPLDLRVREAAAAYEIKRGLPSPLLGDRVVEAKERYSNLPHPAESMVWQFAILGNQEEVDRCGQRAVKIFTDGSKIEGKVGAALSIMEGGAETKALKLKLESHCTVYQAELLAILKATEYVIRGSVSNVGIYSDSRSSLEAIAGRNSLHPLVTQIRRNLTVCDNQNKDISLFWVKAHAGLEGNERADTLAKEAALTLKRKPDYDKCPVSFVKRTLRTESIHEWNGRYKTGTTAGVTKVFFPDVGQAYRTMRKIELTPVITQLFTGHGGFSEYLNRFKCKEDPSCACEPGTAETVPHLLVDCPISGRERWELELKLKRNISEESICTIIANDKDRDMFLNYSIKVINRVINRNKDSI